LETSYLKVNAAVGTGQNVELTLNGVGHFVGLFQGVGDDGAIGLT
jgi:hypothetical protein